MYNASEDYPTLTIEELECINGGPRFRLTRHVSEYYSDEHLDLGKIEALKKFGVTINKLIWDYEQRNKPKEDLGRFNDLDI